MALEVTEIKEGASADKQGHNALVFKFKVIKAPNPSLVGKTLTKWFPLGGPGARVLWRCLKTLDASYDGKSFDTNSFIKRKLEADIELKAGKDGALWPRIEKVYPYFEANEVASTLSGNMKETPAPAFNDDFDV
jgi:hypothetical protein